MRTSLAVVLCCAAAGCGGKYDAEPDGGRVGEAYPKPDSGSSTLQEGLGRLNVYRRAAGLGAVTMDAAISAACGGHLNYLAAEASSSGTCLLQHDEPNTANPYYSAVNEQAGMGALIACVPPASGGLRPARAVDRWIGSLYHRIPLLSPALSTVGLAESDGYVCLNYQQGTGAMSGVQLVTWPAAGMVDVPQGFPGRENPCPTVPSNPQGTPAEQCPASGFIVTATWFGPPGSGAFTSTVAATMTTGAGAALTPLAQYVDGVSNPVAGGMPRTMAFVPAVSLPAQTTIRVQLSGVLDGMQREAVWQFETGTRAE